MVISGPVAGRSGQMGVLGAQRDHGLSLYRETGFHGPAGGRRFKHEIGESFPETPHRGGDSDTDIGNRVSRTAFSRRNQFLRLRLKVFRGA